MCKVEGTFEYNLTKSKTCSSCEIGDSVVIVYVEWDEGHTPEKVYCNLLDCKFLLPGFTDITDFINLPQLSGLKKELLAAAEIFVKNHERVVRGSGDFKRTLILNDF